MSDDDPGHATSVADQLRLAAENDDLPDEIAEDRDLEDSDEEVDDVE